MDEVDLLLFKAREKEDELYDLVKEHVEALDRIIEEAKEKKDYYTAVLESIPQSNFRKVSADEVLDIFRVNADNEAGLSLVDMYDKLLEKGFEAVNKSSLQGLIEHLHKKRKIVKTSKKRYKYSDLGINVIQAS